MESVQQRAEILLEALPYIREFHGKTVVIKYGGAAMESAALQHDFARDVVLLQYVGMKPVVVHGGGPKITRLLGRLGIDSQFIDGHRITDDESMEVAEMVLSGTINKEIVALINREGGRAIGISGKDGSLARPNAHTLTRQKEDGTTEQIPLGRVGTVGHENIDPTVVHDLIKSNYIPVIAPIGADSQGKSMNVNADTMAGAVAAALRAEKLILLTDTKGVLKDGQTVTGLNPAKVHDLIKTGVIQGGMLPKVQCCLDAIQRGVHRTHIIDGRVPHCLLLEVFTDEGVGTLISND